MSLYSQQTYGQPAYAQGGSYPPAAPAPNAYYYQPPPPPAPPTYHRDPASFGREYMARLSDLQFNSRPLIQHLSMLAQEYTHFADVVASSLETHIRRAPAWMKLPAFYVLDAISKNIFEPYARHFSSFVAQLFLETYRQVDALMRNKMEEMLLTWRTGSPTGRELFGAQIQGIIEAGIWGKPTSSNSYPGQITRAQVLSELQFALGQKERHLQTFPDDHTTRNHVAVLHQLRSLVDAGVSQEELRQILTQLRKLVNTVAPVAPTVPAPAPAPAPTTSHWQAPHGILSQRPVLPSQPYPQVQPGVMVPIPSGSNVKSEHLDMLSASIPAGSATIPENITGILSKILGSGAPAGGAPSSTPSLEKADVGPSKEDLLKTKAAATQEYRDAILAKRISLKELTKEDNGIVNFLYGSMGSRCKQCGIRFAGTALGRKELDDHLDMHFQQNRRATQNMGRGHSRGWFTGLDDWIDSGNGKGKERGPRVRSKGVAAEAARAEADLKAQFMVIPPGEESQATACPICKETIKSEFLEDEEEWVWRNAVRKDDKIYHATCHAEASKNVGLLRGSMTPERSPSPSSGKKRKAEENESGTEALLSTPPHKKIQI